MAQRLEPFMDRDQGDVLEAYLAHHRERICEPFWTTTRDERIRDVVAIWRRQRLGQPEPPLAHDPTPAEWAAWERRLERTGDR